MPRKPDNRALFSEARLLSRHREEARTATNLLYALGAAIVDSHMGTLHAIMLGFAECYVRSFRALMKYVASDCGDQDGRGREHVIDLLNVVRKQIDTEMNEIILETAPTQGNSKH